VLRALAAAGVLACARGHIALHDRAALEGLARNRAPL
jgi:hypothetical protein